GVTWFHYTEVNGHPTPSASVKNLTQALLEDAWNGTLQCWNDPVVAAGSGTPSLTYSSPGCQPIILYTAQAGSGTRATWDGYLGYPSTGNQSAGYILSINGKQIPNVQNKKGGTFTETFNSANHIILENEDRAIINNGDEANALFFFSWGKFQVECKVTPSHCGVVPNATGTTKAKLGQINGIPATQNNILCGAAVGGTNCGPTVDFAPTRFIYNVYSNGSDSAIPEATPNTLNYVSEVGFICKPHTVDGTQNGTPIVDPNTGVPYRTEVANVITQAGFIPMPFQASEGSVPHSATALLQAYASANPSNTLDAEFAQVDTVGQSPTAEHGYCLVTTTDNNNNP
ncbi:MAG TPA: hypothetical protein VKY15_03250, partial [Acidimicrobiales bacterium]|nr:hypothetical protein [Acidimicrobiales bacterium]